MMRLLRKTTSMLLLLSYFLLGSGPAQTLLWCQEADGYTHLEFNLAGSCELSCLSEKESHQDENAEPGGASLAPPADDCSDTTLTLQQLRSGPGHPELTKHQLPALSLTIPAGFRTQAVNAPPSKPSPAPLPLPQALVALRTIVLLN